MRTDGRFLNENSLSTDMLDKIKKLDELARKRGQTLAQMALAWVYRVEGITSVLIGAPEVLTVTEEYYHGDAVETTQYQLSKNRSGGYPFPEKFTKRYEDEIQYVVYSFEYERGVFLLRLNFAQ